MTARAFDEPLFIVDNAEGGRDGLTYLSDWCEVAKTFDIATGYFEIGALAALDGQWQKLDKIRLLIGGDTSHGTKKTILEALRTQQNDALDAGLEDDKRNNPFLEGVDAVVAALRDGRIECRVYNRGKFHAKAYITHGRLDVVGSQALVGSSNFTKPGLTQNIELNLKIESGAEVTQLQSWYERHWDDAEDVSPEILRTIEHHTKEYTPFDVYAKALQQLFVDVESTSSDWEQHRSKMFGILDRYQQEAYWTLINIARQHGGALLCDGVGLGKTFVGLMLIERMVLYENKRVVLFAPKGAKEGVWEPALREYLSHIGGVGGNADFSNLTVFSHTDLMRGGDFPDRFARVAELADAVVIDEAHHFRNPGSPPDPDDPESRTRYYRLFDLIGGRDEPKPVYMLTATPINNSLNDFRHLLELFTRRDDKYFSRSLGVNSVTASIKSISRELSQSVGENGSVVEYPLEAARILAANSLFEGLVVQRSRAYAQKSQSQQIGEAAIFPKRADPKVAAYSVRKTYGNLLNMVEEAFEKDKPLFALPIYYPLAYYIGTDVEVDPWQENRQAQVVALIRVNFLKRFESSVYAFERSCDRLLRKLLAFVDKNNETAKEVKHYERWIDQHAGLLAYAQARQLEFWSDEEKDDDEDDDVISPEMLEAATLLSRDEYDVPGIFKETYQDLDQLAAFLSETRRFDHKHDDKFKKLVRLLKSKEISDRKVLIFTEFADTARYIGKHLRAEGIDGVVQIDSGSKLDRAEILRRFAPYYNGSSSEKIAASGRDEIRVLVSTDVLSEGLNLQDATRLVNYDIHWNPVRLMQRIGRVDRRLNPRFEALMVKDHPEVASDRGKVAYWNFLPPDDLDCLLKLYNTVSRKALVISTVLGIEGRKFITPEDNYEAVKEFNASYEGKATVIEEMRLEYQQLLDDHLDLEERLVGFPGAVFSGREHPKGKLAGVFFCYRLPALDKEAGEFTLEAGVTRWYFDSLAGDTILEGASEIAARIRSTFATPRHTVTERATLVSARDRVEKHIKNTYLKRVDAPIGVNPVLRCWMELNGG